METWIVYSSLIGLYLFNVVTFVLVWRLRSHQSHLIDDQVIWADGIKFDIQKLWAQLKWLGNESSNFDLRILKLEKPLVTETKLDEPLVEPAEVAPAKPAKSKRVKSPAIKKIKESLNENSPGWFDPMATAPVSKESPHGGKETGPSDHGGSTLSGDSDE